ncbi:MAG TPA: PKD domain-containing protein [Vicinamibacterales bacterium]|nr:PKD domain-containing protein [Vicinamibacterales bacterium]
MVPQTRSTALRRLAAIPAVLTALAALSLASACDKVPLLAPSGTVITLFPAASSVPVNGQVEIVATVIENGVAATTPPATPGTPGTPAPPGTTTTNSPGAGTPVQNGTLVSFTTTLGRIEPSEARTTNGQVRVKFIATGQSGQATITAFSGGASGKIENLLVGSAAAERVLVSATPQTLGPAGGQAQISARVEDTSGAGLVGVPVTFSTTAGQLSASSVVTDNSGTALTVLTTSRESTVTANVAGKTAEITIGLNPRTGITLTGPTTSISAGLPATFTVGVGSTANVRDVTLDFGDGSRQSLGAISGSTTVQHTYVTPDTYTVNAIATEASGFTEQVATSVTILPGQPPGVIITPSNTTPTRNQIITLTATVSGATSTILQYQWDFGDGTTATTTGPQITKSYADVGTKVIRVTVVQAVGPSGQGQTTVDVRQ